MLTFASSHNRVHHLPPPSLELMIQHFGNELTRDDCIIVGILKRQDAEGNWPDDIRFDLAIMNSCIYRSTKAEKIPIDIATNTFLSVKIGTYVARVTLLTIMDTEGFVYEARSSKKSLVLAESMIVPNNMITDAGMTRNNYLGFVTSTITRGRKFVTQYTITADIHDMLKSSAHLALRRSIAYGS